MADLINASKAPQATKPDAYNEERLVIAQNDAPSEDKGEGGKVKGFFRKAKEVAKEAKGQFKEDFKEAREGFGEDLKEAKQKVREDFGLKAKPENPAAEVTQTPEQEEKKPGGLAQRIVKGASAVLPHVDLGRGGNSALSALELADSALNPKERKEANAMLSGASILAGGKSLDILPKGISEEVLNKVIEINFPKDRELSAADLKNLSPEEQKLVKHRMEVGKNIESSREISDAEWQATVKNAEQQKYTLPPEANGKILSLEDYLKKQTGQTTTTQESNSSSSKQGRTVAEQPTPGVSNAASGQFIAYVGGKQVSADLAVSSTLKDKHGDPVVLNRDALLRFEGAMAEVGVIPVTSSFRTHDEQTQLYRNYLSGNNPYPVAQPGFSKHQSGFALDISVKSGNQEAIHAAMTKAGFVRPIPASDPVHWVYVGPVSSGKNPVTA